MNKLCLIVSLSFLYFYSYSQEFDEIIKFSKIDSTIKNVKLIGVGESTHGTSEFTTVRLELFKFLVENHDYNTFFLEADYSACIRVNRYIQGQQDNVYRALEEIYLWPWLTEEMVEIIDWCREYNSQNVEKISFVGCDMQLISDDYKELQRLFKNDQSLLIKVDSIFPELGRTFNDSVIFNRKSKWNDFKNFVSDSDLRSQQVKDFEKIKLFVDQWFDFKTSTGIKYNFRDSCMASNMIEYLNQDSSSKGFYFAHNGHVSNTIFSHKEKLSKKSAGAFLKDFYGERYFCIAVLSRDLHFNALSCKGGSIKMKQFQRTPDKYRDVERELTNYGSDSFYISTKKIDKIHKFNITFIGAAYEEDCNGIKPFPKRRLTEDMFDGFILLGTTNPTQFIEKIKKKYG